MPKTWDIQRKGISYIKRPLPGPHGFNYGLALSVFLKDILKIAKTAKEVKNILNNHDLLVDGVKRQESKFIVGFLDVISIPTTKENFRINQERYEEQMNTSTDVLDARTLLSRTMTNYYTSLYDFKISKASLYKAMGRVVLE